MLKCPQGQDILPFFWASDDQVFDKPSEWAVFCGSGQVMTKKATLQGGQAYCRGNKSGLDPRK
jgi:hypothetical protein